MIITQTPDGPVVEGWVVERSDGVGSTLGGHPPDASDGGTTRRAKRSSKFPLPRRRPNPNLFREPSTAQPRSRKPAGAPAADDPEGSPAEAGGTTHGVGITMLVTDLRRSVGFYRDLLGFLEIDSGASSAVLTFGDTRLVLRTIPDIAQGNRRLVHLNLEVADVTATYQDLRGKGVEFTYAPRPVNKGERLELWAAAFRDLDGNVIAITQWRSRETGGGSAEPTA